MQIDEIFKDKRPNILPFEFNSQVVSVFDDMVSRSVPNYNQIHEVILDLTKYLFSPGDTIVDMGCSTGTTLKLLDSYLGTFAHRLIGIDSSAPMIAKANEKLNAHQKNHIQLICEDLCSYSPPEQMAIGILNYTLQFIPLENRLELLQKIFAALRPGGALILSEKIQSKDVKFESLITDIYYDFKKRNGYSELEIAQKRQALEDVLTPQTIEEHYEMLKRVGFNCIEMPFRWYNFACFVAIKS